MQNNPTAAAITTLRSQFIGRPLAILPSRAVEIVQMLLSSEAMRIELSDHPTQRKPYDVVSGIAVVYVHGVLTHERCWYWGETTYREIAAAMVAAMQDADVSAVAMHINSPGGLVNGCFDLVDGIYGLRGIKPIWAILDEEAYSAAYALASAADRITVPRTGGTGSIGILTQHVDITAALDKAGIKVSTIQYGAQKSDFQPTTPLSDEARARAQARADTMGDLFVETVARNRGISADKVRKTEAGIFLGDSGLEQGLVDAVMAPDAAFLSLLDTLR